MIALVGCRIRRALVIETEEWNARTTRERVPNDQRVDDRRRHGRVHDGAGDLVSEGELIDRRQRAREAYWDDMRGLSMRTSGIEAAIEVATRVQITPEIIEAARAGWLAASTDRASWVEEPGPRQYGRLAAAFRAAGFEVVE